MHPGNDDRRLGLHVLPHAFHRPRLAGEVELAAGVGGELHRRPAGVKAPGALRVALQARGHQVDQLEVAGDQARDLGALDLDRDLGPVGERGAVDLGE